MDHVTMSDLRELVSIESENCISLFMPTNSLGIEGQQDAVRLKNLVSVAERRLIDQGMRSVNAHEYVAPISVLPVQKEWPKRKKGLAIFRSREQLLTYWLASAVDENVVVAQRFYVRPLLTAVAADGEFYILALSRNECRLLRATADGIERIELPDLPKGIEKALNLQGADRGEQVHAGARVERRKEAAVFHGQGGHRDTIKDEVVEYFQLVDKSLGRVLRGRSYRSCWRVSTMNWHYSARCATTSSLSKTRSPAVSATQQIMPCTNKRCRSRGSTMKVDSASRSSNTNR